MATSRPTMRFLRIACSSPAGHFVVMEIFKEIISTSRILSSLIAAIYRPAFVSRTGPENVGESAGFRQRRPLWTHDRFEARENLDFRQSHRMLLCGCDPDSAEPGEVTSVESTAKPSTPWRQSHFVSRFPDRRCTAVSQSFGMITPTFVLSAVRERVNKNGACGRRRWA